MPGIVGVVQILQIGSSGVFNIGDIYKVTPYSNAKTFSGAGSFNTGDFVAVNNPYSATNTYDADAIDEPIAFTL